MRGLTVLEQIILSAIVSLEDEAFGVAIRKKVKAFTGKGIMYGTLYNALDCASSKVSDNCNRLAKLRFRI
ncbi:MAG: hypothetical protein OEY18_05735 [Candidatus Aminicenantes bacterium]|nr:hypothetical protein [Candidatus Aminicenantes bacterium]MDH5384191.1 hypothetical protein [Candidatus Aminicenantes bacterium]MDH5742954.1 hypothetical protein [Candidatus Aminicenantes bacterium]